MTAAITVRALLPADDASSRPIPDGKLARHRLRTSAHRQVVRGTSQRTITGARSPITTTRRPSTATMNVAFAPVPNAIATTPGGLYIAVALAVGSDSATTFVLAAQVLRLVVTMLAAPLMAAAASGALAHRLVRR